MVKLADGLQSAIQAAREHPNKRRTFLTGGATLYNEGLATDGSVDRVLLTRILAPDFEDCDTFLAPFQEKGGWEQADHAQLREWVGFDVPEGVQEEKGVQYEFQMWTRV